ncbi:MAG TPA: helix-turn-helix domain-containing protein [Candidatus Binataceae bacterium]|nr:helix-turn-helix domain-containing protein [Candidatus Binataceae bacterium]HVB80025.1 helix-turn-helix domain-containing protein [Candidatus Binataceae bacterium]
MNGIVAEAAPQALTVLPTLDDLARDPTRARGLSAEVRGELIARAAAVTAALAAPLIAELGRTVQREQGASNDKMLTVHEAAEILRCRPRWIYDHAEQLPFIRRRSRKCLLCSESGLRKWLAARRPMT